MNPKEKDDEIIKLTDEELDEIFADDDFDNYEVIGIRSGMEYYDSFEEDKVVISLKKPSLDDCNYKGHLNNMEAIK